MLQRCKASVWLVVGLVLVLVIVCACHDSLTFVARYWCGEGNKVNGTPNYIMVSNPDKLPRLTCEVVQGVYNVRPQKECPRFRFILLPNGVYKGHFGYLDSSSHHEWFGNWRLDASNWRVYVEEWPEGAERYSAEYRHCRWYINLRRGITGGIERSGYICHYQRLTFE